MGVNSGLYKTVEVLHILAAVVGFGAVLWNGFYAVHSKRRPPREALAINEANFAASLAASWAIYLVALLGLALVGLSDGAYRMGDLWVTTSILTFIVALSISHGLLAPNGRRMLALQAELVELDGAELSGPPEQAVELADRAKRQAALGTVNAALTVFLVYLMVFRPWG
jgi:uncharacterized membrane protein